MPDTAVFRPESGGETRFLIRWRAGCRLELSAEQAGEEHFIIFAASIEVLECYLFGMFGDDIRESLGLPFLQLSWNADNLADGFELSEMARGYRTLTRTGAGPVAAARDATLSLVTLVPLSHFLQLGVPALKRSLSQNGSPLLTDAGDYALPEEIREGNPSREDSRERD